MSGELQALNQQNKLAVWAERVTACRNSGLRVKDWCKENGICEQTYYKWQKRIYELSKFIFFTILPLITVLQIFFTNKLSS